MKIEIETPFDIGQEFWFIWKNKLEIGWISEICVTITSYTIEGESWYEQFMRRVFNRKQKEIFKQYKPYFKFNSKVDIDFRNYSLDEIKGKYYLFNDIQIYFTKEECINSITKF
jgi:hypothetical protein